MNATTVLKILRGTVQPQPTTLYKMRSWYERQSLPAPQQAALDTVLGRIPDGPVRAQAAELVRAVVRLGSESAGLRPGWVRRPTVAELRAGLSRDRRRSQPRRGAFNSP